MSLIEKKMVIKNKQGLHARPAAVFVQIANKFSAAITLKKGKEVVNGKSIMGILMLGAEKGSVIYLEADGDDAENAVVELQKIIEGEE